MKGYQGSPVDTSNPPRGESVVPARCGPTHHNACTCREQYVARLEAEHAELRNRFQHVIVLANCPSLLLAPAALASIKATAEAALVLTRERGKPPGGGK